MSFEPTMDKFDVIDTTQITSTLWTTQHGCLHSSQEAVLLGKEFRAGFGRSSAARFFFRHSWELFQLRVFYKTKESPIHSFLKQCCSCLEKAGSEQQKILTFAVTQPFPSHAVQCMDGLRRSVVPVHGASQGNTAIYLIAAACWDPSCSSPTQEIAACLCERSAMAADCFKSFTSTVEVSKFILPGCSCLSHPWDSSLKKLCITSTQGEEVMSTRSCHPAYHIALWNPVCGWSFHKLTTEQFLDILCSEFVPQGSYKLGIWDTP